ncbi:ABC transporter ATP-binding protein [Pararobbsia silviterrae]|uniref:ATP-binding cassette domain-containing protein n=1 Tax=Pararobbsia silviterrae TaxID=1792498 RepID=A0A494XWF9_9BURK|nr:ATP-binding cassette domain-containing protein [Pararobbsia silviterrae]RKP54900.1 ATP-binding cassette domain-containing protein [Pararobbsia silviterrae]
MLEAVQLSRTDDVTGTTLLHPCDLTLARGERLVVTGPSGSGKSVLMRALAWLDRPQGVLRWHGHAIDRARVPAFRAAVAYVRQRPALFDGRVEDNLRVPFELHIHRHRRYERERVLAYLAHAGRDATFLEQRADDLSGGEQQLVALVRTLQLAPSVLLLDEPTASLDPQTTLAVEAMIDGWFEHTPQAAFAWVTHDLAQARRVGRRFATVHAGVFATSPPP